MDQMYKTRLFIPLGQSSKREILKIRLKTEDKMVINNKNVDKYS